MLNEFERRFLNVAQNNADLLEAMAEAGATGVPEHFGYSLSLGTAADPFVTNVRRQGTISIQSDAWFVLQYVTVGVILPNGNTNGDLTMVTMANDMNLQITDTGAGRDLYNNAAPAAILAGSPLVQAAGIPFVMPTPRVIPPNTNVTVQMAWFLASAVNFVPPNQAWITLNGARVPL